MSSMEVGLRPCACTESFHGTRLVAVTGGPGAGKTAVLAMALRSFCSHVSVLPEAAGVVFGGGFPRRDTDVARQAAQRAIFYIQRELEAIVTGEGRVAVGLCDRGTVDGAAYWPGPAESFWSEIGTSLEDELARYSAVIHLRTPGVEQGYNHENALRVESASQARSIDERILAAWAKHPCRLVVDSDDDFLLKAARAMESIRDQLPPCCRVHSLPHESAGRGE